MIDTSPARLLYRTMEIVQLRLDGWSLEAIAERVGMTPAQVDDIIVAQCAESSRQRAARADPATKMQLQGLSRQAAVAFATAEDDALPWPTRMQAIQSHWQLLNRYEGLLRTIGE